MKLKDVESQCGLAKSATTLNIDAEGAVKKRGNDNVFLHGVFDNKVDPSSLAFILPILRVTKQKEEEYGIYVIIAYTFQVKCKLYCFCPQVIFTLASILPFF